MPPTPVEGPADRTVGCVRRVRWSAGPGCRSRASQSNLASRRPLCFTGARTERQTEQRTAIQERPLVVGGCFVFPGARTKRWPAAAAPNMPSPTARSRTLSAAAARDAPPARTQLAEAASPATSRAAGAAILSAPGQTARAHRMRDGSVPTSISGKTDAAGPTSLSIFAERARRTSLSVSAESRRPALGLGLRGRENAQTYVEDRGEVLQRRGQVVAVGTRTKSALPPRCFGDG